MLVGVGRGGRYALVLVGSLVFGLLARTALAAVGVTTAALVLPLFTALLWLAFAWYEAQERRRPQCPNCELPLAYRRLGPSHGMLECPALCGYRTLVGDRRPRS